MQVRTVMFKGFEITITTGTEEEFLATTDENLPSEFRENASRPAVGPGRREQRAPDPCGLGLEGWDDSFDAVTPEDIIGGGVPDRDWTARVDHEKRAWHLHVGFFGTPCGYCIGAVYADTEDEAADEAISDYLVHYELEHDDAVSFPWDFENEDARLAYCFHDLGEQCETGCEKIQVIRMS